MLETFFSEKMSLALPSWLIFTLLVALSVGFASPAIADEDDDLRELMLSKEEKYALEKLKPQVMNYLTEGFMRSDFYLIRWIRMADLDVAGAKSLLLRNVKWRQQHNISNILREDFSDMEPDFHMSFYGGRDKKGRPFGTIELGEWDLRGAVLQGRTKRLNHFLVYALERGMQELFRAQKGFPRPITKMSVLVDGDGGNAMQHLCPNCLAILMTWIQNMEMYYPRLLHEIIMINAPPITSIGLKVLKPAMSPETQAALKIFDQNKKVWMPYLDKRIDRDQRTRRYGGTRPEEPNQHFYESVYKNDFKYREL